MSFHVRFRRGTRQVRHIFCLFKMPTMYSDPIFYEPKDTQIDRIDYAIVVDVRIAGIAVVTPIRINLSAVGSTLREAAFSNWSSAAA